MRIGARRPNLSQKRLARSSAVTAMAAFLPA
jgi:hypothetical protein